MGQRVAEIDIVLKTGNAKRDLDNLKKSSKELETNISRVKGEKPFAGLSNDARKSKASIDGLTGSTKSLGSQFSLLRGLIVGSGIALLGRQLFDVARETDHYNAILKTATGTMDLAKDKFKQLNQFASQTPFTLKETVEGFVKLKNLGLDPTDSAMRSFGNTASAMGKSLNQMIEAVADASTNEFERLKEFGIKSRKEGDNVTFTFQGIATTVKASSEDIKGYLVGLGNTKFASAMSDQMDTLNGKLSNLKQNYDNLLRGIGGGDAFKSVIDTVSNSLVVLGDNIGTVESSIKAISVGIASLLIPKLLSLPIKFASAFAISPVVNMRNAVLALNLAIRANPIGLLVSGAVALFSYRKELEKLVLGSRVAVDIGGEQAKTLELIEKATLNAATATNAETVEIRKKISAKIDLHKADLQEIKSSIAYSRAQVAIAKSSTGLGGGITPATKNRIAILKDEIGIRNKLLSNLGEQTRALKKLDIAVGKVKQSKLSTESDVNAINSTSKAYDKLVNKLKDSINARTLSRVEQIKLTDAYNSSTSAQQKELELLAGKLDMLGKTTTRTKTLNEEINVKNDLIKQGIDLLKSAKDKAITLSFKTNIADSSLSSQEQDRVNKLAEIAGQRRILIENGVSVALADKLSAQLKVNDATERANALQQQGANLVRTAKDKSVELSFKVGIQDGNLSSAQQQQVDELAIQQAQRYKLVREGLNVTYINEKVALDAKNRASQAQIAIETRHADALRASKIELADIRAKVGMIPSVYAKWSAQQRILRGETTSAIEKNREQIEVAREFNNIQNDFATALGNGEEAVKSFFKNYITQFLIAQATAKLSDLFNIGTPQSSGLGGLLGSLLPKFATGGRISAGGSGGVDSQLVSFYKSPNEQVDITTPAQRQGSDKSGGITVIINESANAFVYTKQIDAKTVEIIARSEAQKAIDEQPKFEDQIADPNSREFQALQQNTNVEYRRA